MGSDVRTIHMSSGRYRASPQGGFSSTVILEKTRQGVLVTELDTKKGVIDQQYFKTKSVEELISLRLGNDVTLERVAKWDRTTLEVGCDKCGTPLIRELEFLDPVAIEEVPVMPIFRCTACDKRFYSATKEYLGRLVDRNNSMFDEKERVGLDDNRDSFINIMNEYVIRIFASKKISRIPIKE